MSIVIDTQTFASHGGGIAHFFAPLLQSWARAKSGSSLVMVGPAFEVRSFGIPQSLQLYELRWPTNLPRLFRHPYYDNVLFPKAIRALRPSGIFSPYHDVRLPVGIPSVVTVHDLCLEELEGVYPLKIRAYYQAMLHLNLKRAHFLVTVSETSRQAIIERYRWSEDRIAVVYNTLSPEFTEGTVALESINNWRTALKLKTDGPLLLYTAGIEYRKNIPRLLRALDFLCKDGQDLVLLVTGWKTEQWKAVLAGTTERVQARVRFLGYLSLAELRLAYSAVDAVVFPSLGEGFGRACLESMACGTPIACSDLPVLREVAGDYATYFNPRCPEAIAQGVRATLVMGKKSPVIDSRFELKRVQSSFVGLMAEVLCDRVGIF